MAGSYLRDSSEIGIEATMKFSDTVCNELGNYVYRLVDPRNGETFYVGRGKRNRIFDHVNQALKSSRSKGTAGEKFARIREIYKSGLQVSHIIHRHGLADGAVSDVEAALIDAYSGLSNIHSGQGSNDRGVMHALQIVDKYNLPSIDNPPEYKQVLLVTSRQVVWLFFEQLRFEFVPILHRLQGRLAAQG